MKLIINKIIRYSFALIIPAAFLVGCQEDLSEPTNAMPHKGQVGPKRGEGGGGGGDNLEGRNSKLNISTSNVLT